MQKKTIGIIGITASILLIVVSIGAACLKNNDSQSITLSEGEIGLWIVGSFLVLIFFLGFLTFSKTKKETKMTLSP